MEATVEQLSETLMGLPRREVLLSATLICQYWCLSLGAIVPVAARGDSHVDRLQVAPSKIKAFAAVTGYEKEAVSISLSPLRLLLLLLSKAGTNGYDCVMRGIDSDMTAFPAEAAAICTTSNRQHRRQPGLGDGDPWQQHRGRCSGNARLLLGAQGPSESPVPCKARNVSGCAVAAAAQAAGFCRPAVGRLQ